MDLRPGHGDAIASSGDPARVDTSVLDRIAGLSPDSGRDIVRSVIEAYLESSPGYIQELSAGTSDGNLDRIRNAAHSLKSSAASVGATNFAALCRRVEEAARGGDDSAVVASVPAIEDVHPAVCDSLRYALKSFS